MDSIRLFPCSLNCSYARSSEQFQLKYRNEMIPYHSFFFPRHRNSQLPRFSWIFCCVSPTTEEMTRQREKEGEEEEEEEIQFRKWRDVVLKVRLDHQVQDGEHVAIIRSTRELGSWKKSVPLNWSENGWVCDLDLKGGDSVEYKFVIIRKDNSMSWEGGSNRVLQLPKKGVFSSVCRWNATDEALELLQLEEEVEEEEEKREGVSNDESLKEVEMSPFVGQWQGKAVSFMRSNEHGNRENERKWDTSGLQGLALKLVEGDRNARNW